MARKKNIKTEQPFILAPGVSTSPAGDDVQKDYNYSIALKAIVVVLLTVGSIGSYLSAVGITYSVPVFILVAVFQAVIFSLFYRSEKWENLGALLFFLVFLIVGMTFRLVINSGFYAVVNKTTERVTFYFNTSGMRTYTEKITNRYVTVTAFAITIAVVLEFLLFNNVLRSASYVWCIILTVTLNLIMIYIRKMPSPVYMIMLAAGIMLTVVFRSGGHYRLFREKSGYAKTKRGFTYTADTTTLLQIMLLTTCAVIVIIAGVSAFAGISTFDDSQPKSVMKADSEDEVKNAFLLGFDGLFNRYQSKGGLNSGRLGGVSRVTQDGQPDLEITFAPYSQDTIYIRNFIGEQYNPVENYWSVYQDEKDSGTSYETAALQKSFEKGSGARGVMTIKNVGADTRPYQPYYTSGGKEDLAFNKTENVTYYPLLDIGDMEIKDRDLDEDYLSVPDVDRQAVADFCRKAGLKQGMDPETATGVIRDYFQKNYPYTLRPGATPRDRDFVEYFLTTNKKGYCAHFASSAVLILRYLGIPARYCEGYAVSMDSLANNAELKEGAKYEDYYSGENPLGRSAVVKTTASDLNAHAWIEIYEKGHGWVRQEVTPYSTEDNDNGGFLSDLLDIFNGGGNSTSTTQNNDTVNDNGGSADGSGLSLGRMRAFFLFLIIVLVSPAIWYGFMRLCSDMKYRRAFAKADRSDRLILYYQRQADRLRKKNSGFRKCVNYSEQLSYISPEMPSQEKSRLVEILDRAGFSPAGLTEDEYEWAMNELGQNSRKRRHTASNSDRV